MLAGFSAELALTLFCDVPLLFHSQGQSLTGSQTVTRVTPSMGPSLASIPIKVTAPTTCASPGRISGWTGNDQIRLHMSTLDLSEALPEA